MNSSNKQEKLTITSIFFIDLNSIENEAYLLDEFLFTKINCNKKKKLENKSNSAKHAAIFQ